MSNATKEYNTEIVKISNLFVSKSKIKKMASIIKSGNVVAFPTETVYGLGANALNSNAVNKIFKAKGRPSDNPLIVHISNYDQLDKLTTYIPINAKKLMDKFWPGPLTIILKKTNLVPDETTAKRPSVGIRMPNHKIALALIEQSGCPIAAPSANSFSKPSPTLAKHVAEDLTGKISAIIDGGNCKVGVESTIIDFSDVKRIADKPIILRPGGVTIEAIESIIGNVNLHETVLDPKQKVKNALAPGMKYKHYSPNANVILFESKTISDVVDFKKEISNSKSIGIITLNQDISSFDIDFKEIKAVKSSEILAKEIFKFFREMDEKGIDTIIVDKIPNKDLGISILNRVKKAASKII